jgi:hypothetical protein
MKSRAARFIMNDVERLQAWIAYVFDHAVTEPEWYSSAGASDEEWPDAPVVIVTHIAETFEHGRELLSRFSDEQLNQGFWFLFGNSKPDFMFALLDEKIPVAIRLRALRSFVPLFEQVMAARCSPHLSYLDEQPANPLNSSCYMWFDELLDRFSPQELERAQLDAELLVTLRRILDIPHDACRESALHGIGHWVGRYPQLADTVDEFLSNACSLRPELITYAERARIRNIS